MGIIYKILGLALFMAVVSCTSDCENLSAIFTNNSGKNIIAYSYKKPYKEMPYLFKEMQISNNSSISNTWKSCADEPIRSDFYMLLEGDSIIIDFGDKTKCFKRTEWNHYSLQKPSNPNIYILTPEDYANASPKP